MREKVLEQLRSAKIIAIARGIERDKCIKLARALFEGGIRFMELPYDQSRPDTWLATAETVALLADTFGDRLCVGAGTVLTPELVELTKAHGGQYVVAPNTNPAVIRRAGELGMVSVPGAMTPTEIAAAHDAGADIVKLFPASELGTGYLKAIRAPLSHIDILAAGGITPSNARAFLDAGAMSLGVGGVLTNRAAIAEGRFCDITKAAETLLRSVE